ncbi:PH domain-containing protein [Trichinella spiralis]|uniref:PH domain-containing protein n=1 Tax=Trichinella spiralis TaxID=6334 RepID=A0ABR3KIV6_TRISP
MENQMVKSVHLKDHIGDKNRLINNEEKNFILKRNLAENTSLCQRKLIKNCLSSRNTDLSNFQTLTSTRRSEKWNQNNFFLCIVSAIPPISDLKPVAELDFDEYWNFVEKML